MSGITLMAGMVNVLGGSGGGGGGGGGGTPPSFTVTATPTSVSKTRYGVDNLDMGAITAVKGAGGTGPFVKRWVLYSGPGIITPNQYAQYSTAFTARPEALGVFTDVWRMRVTDNATGEEVFSNTVTLTITVLSSGGGGGGGDIP